MTVSLSADVTSTVTTKSCSLSTGELTSLLASRNWRACSTCHCRSVFLARCILEPAPVRRLPLRGAASPPLQGRNACKAAGGVGGGINAQQATYPSSLASPARSPAFASSRDGTERRIPCTRGSVTARDALGPLGSKRGGRECGRVHALCWAPPRLRPRTLVPRCSLVPALPMPPPPPRSWTPEARPRSAPANRRRCGAIRSEAPPTGGNPPNNACAASRGRRRRVHRGERRGSRGVARWRQFAPEFGVVLLILGTGADDLIQCAPRRFQPLRVRAKVHQGARHAFEIVHRPLRPNTGNWPLPRRGSGFCGLLLRGSAPGSAGRGAGGKVARVVVASLVLAQAPPARPWTQISQGVGRGHGGKAARRAMVAARTELADPALDTRPPCFPVPQPSSRIHSSPRTAAKARTRAGARAVRQVAPIP